MLKLPKIEPAGWLPFQKEIWSPQPLHCFQ